MGIRGQNPVPPAAEPDALRARVAVAFTTLLRAESASRLVESVFRHLPGVPIHVGLQGKLPELRERIGSSPDVYIHPLGFDVGLSAARNALFRRIDRPYVLILDDDMRLTEETDLATALAILEAHPDVGVVGGRYAREYKRDRQDRPFVPTVPPRFEFFIEGHDHGVLRLRRLSDVYGEGYDRDPSAFHLADVVHNAALVRRNLVTEKGGAWDEAMKVGGEHLDFYLNVKIRSLCRVAFHAGLAVEHYRETGGDYAAFRGRAVGTVALLRKWDLYRREVAGDASQTLDYRLPPPPKRARPDRIGLGERAHPARRLLGPRFTGLVRPHRVARTLARLVVEERYRHVLDRSRADPMLQNVFAARNRRWVFVQASKCGCTFVKKVLHEIEHGPTRWDDEMDVHTDHHLDSGLQMHPGEVVDLLRSERTWRFAFVRNPFARALSAWLDKFADPSRTPSLTSVATSAWIRHHRRSGDPSAPVGFSEFLDYVAGQPPSEMDRHWRPVYDALAFDRIHYHFVGRVERLGDDLTAVLERIGAREHLELARGAPSNVTNAAQAIERHYDGACIDRVRRIYRRDFEAFDYPTDPERILPS